MIVVRLMGGTGNQMFQYALGRSLAIKHNTELRFDLSFLDSEDHDELHVRRKFSLDMFSIEKNTVSLGEIDRLGLTHIVEPHFHFCESILHAANDILLDGYWQSEKYFHEISGILRKDFSILAAKGADHEMCKKFSKSNSICINVRRGDFVDNSRSRSFHGILGLEYLEAAYAVIRENIPNPEVFVFSDDIEWCENNISFDCPCEVIGHEHAGDRFSLYLHYMSMFENFIIPNSSFAWWAVWLSEKKGRVVAPKRWFQDDAYSFVDLIPDYWITI